MKKNLLILPLLFFIFIGCQTPPEPTLTIESYKYFVILPNNYEQQDSCPAILFLHGRGGGTSSIENFNSYGLGQYAEQNTDFPFIIIAPQATDDWFTEPIDKILNSVSENYKVDQSRLYCTGYSLGGNAAFRLAVEYPDRFAALALVAGWGDTEDACEIKDVPVWIFHDSNDPVVPYSWALELETALVNCGGTVNFTTYQTDSHSYYNEAYFNPELYSWFLGFGGVK